MSSASYQEAIVCPECKMTGNVRLKRVAPKQAGLPRGTMVHSVYCENKLCSWYNTAWMIQVNPDGSVPAPRDHRGEPKIYEGFQGHDEMARRIIERAEQENKLSLRPGGEVRG